MTEVPISTKRTTVFVLYFNYEVKHDKPQLGLPYADDNKSVWLPGVHYNTLTEARAHLTALNLSTLPKWKGYRICEVNILEEHILDDTLTNNLPRDDDWNGHL